MLIFATVLSFATTFVVVGFALLLVWFALQKGQDKNSAPEPALPETSKLLRDESISTISLWSRLLEKFDFIDLMKRHLEQANLTWSIGRVTLSMLLTGTIALVILVKGDWFPAWVDGALAYAAALLPYLFILQRRKQRLAKFEEQFPDALDSLTRALRAGHAFAVALELVVNEAEPPISVELRRAMIERNFGASWEQSLANLANRVPLLQVNMFAAAVQLHSRTGGKLSEVLATLSDGMRESAALKGEVNAIAAHGRMTGIILTALPAVIAIVMTVVNPSYLQVLFESPYGKYLISGALVCLVAAHFLIRRIVDIKV